MSDARATVLGVVRRPATAELFVQRLDVPASEPFYRPVGGGIHQGETSDDALEREFREELSVEITAGAVVGTVENVFDWDGERQGEVAILREATFDDESLYDRERFDGVDAGGRVEYEASWQSLDALRAAPEPLYPEGVERLLDPDGDDAGRGRGHLVSTPE